MKQSGAHGAGRANELAALPQNTNLASAHYVGQLVERPDALALLLADKRSDNTKRAYEYNVKLFLNGSTRLKELFARDPVGAVWEFLSWPPHEIGLEIAEFKGRQIAKGYAEETVNQRLYSVKALLKWAFKRNFCQTDGRGLVEGEKTRRYRDTRGIDAAQMKRLVKAPLARKIPARGKKQTEKSLRGFDLKTVRDVAILKLFCENGLRRSEILRLTVEDLSIEGARMAILGKGRGSQKEPVSVDPETAQIIATYLLASGHYGDSKGALFRSCDHRPGMRTRGLSKNGIYKIVREHGAAIGEAKLHPHDLRHSAISFIAEKTNGNIPEILAFSRHADANTAMKYVHNAKNVQGKLTRLIAEALK